MEHNARPADARLAHLARINKLEYQYRTRAANKRAARDEAELVQSYCGWSKDRKHKLGRVDFGKNGQCDLFEEERRNLLEAKCSASREHIRMAVGQLLDYAYLGRERFRGGPHMAILLPEKPDLKSLAWLREQRIWVVWREKGKFLDNASGQFV
jgi:5-methylcytosine-specific restriction protein A